MLLVVDNFLDWFRKAGSRVSLIVGDKAKGINHCLKQRKYLLTHGCRLIAICQNRQSGRSYRKEKIGSRSIPFMELRSVLSYAA